MEEELLRRITDGKQPFRVPEGYWESMRERMEEIVPAGGAVRAKCRKTAGKRLRILAYAAGLCAVLSVCTAYYLSRGGETVAFSADNDARQIYDDEAYMEEMADYAMLDNQDFYSYMSGE